MEEKTRRCTQTKCFYFLKGGCKACSECKAESYVINTECMRCLACENNSNALRFDDPRNKYQMEVEKAKVLIEMLNNVENVLDLEKEVELK
jgi:hypothetical protein